MKTKIKQLEDKLGGKWKYDRKKREWYNGHRKVITGYDTESKKMYLLIDEDISRRIFWS